MTSPTLSSSAGTGSPRLCFARGTSSGARPDLRPLRAGAARHSGAGTATSAWAASAGLQVTSVRPSAWAGAERSGEGDPGGGGGCDAGCVPAGGGGRSGCGDGGRGAGTRAGRPACAGAGASASACDGGCLAPAGTTSSPSCGPWSSCCRW